MIAQRDDLATPSRGYILMMEPRLASLILISTFITGSINDVGPSLVASLKAAIVASRAADVSDA